MLQGVLSIFIIKLNSKRKAPRPTKVKVAFCLTMFLVLLISLSSLTILIIKVTKKCNQIHLLWSRRPYWCYNTAIAYKFPHSNVTYYGYILFLTLQTI